MITCHVCNKQFSSEDALKQHERHAHSQKEVQQATAMPKKVVWIGVAVIAVLAIGWFFFSYATPGDYDSFAQCIASSGAKFYGAFWCPHCQDQKALFGKSQKYLPYVECSTSDGKGQLEVCQQAGIRGYPTWIFADGSQANQLTLQELSQRTNCPLN